MGDRPRPKRPDVLLVSGLTGSGVTDVLAALDRRAPARQGPMPDEPGPAQLARAEAQVTGLLAERMAARLREPAQRDRTAEVIARVARHELDPYSAADELLEAAASSGPMGERR
jgi:putative protein kinase ArgK-like GTPase of G3E family